MLIQVLGNTDIRLNELQYLATHSLEMGKITVMRNSKEYNIRIPDNLLDGLYKYIDHEAIINISYSSLNLSINSNEKNSAPLSGISSSLAMVTS